MRRRGSRRRRHVGAGLVRSRRARGRRAGPRASAALETCGVNGFLVSKTLERHELAGAGRRRHVGVDELSAGGRRRCRGAAARGDVRKRAPGVRLGPGSYRVLAERLLVHHLHHQGTLDTRRRPSSRTTPAIAAILARFSRCLAGSMRFFLAAIVTESPLPQWRRPAARCRSRRRAWSWWARSSCRRSSSVQPAGAAGRAVDVGVDEQLGGDLRERVCEHIEGHRVGVEEPPARFELAVVHRDEAAQPVEEVAEAVEVAVEQQVDPVGLVRAARRVAPPLTTGSIRSNLIPD